MATLREEAKAYKPTQTHNIADLDKVSLDVPMQDRKAKDKDGKEFSYKVALVNDQEYRVPISVINDIKAIQEAKPNVKNIKVVKKGVGMSTEYTVVPLDWCS